MESLIPYDKRLNAYHDKEHDLSKDSCEGMISNVLKPVLEEIKKKEKEEGRYRTAEAKEDCQFMIKLLKGVKSCIVANPMLKVHLEFI